MTNLTSRALVLDSIDEPMTVKTFDVRDPGVGEVRVALKASGVCHSDLHTRDGGWGSNFPVILGHEGAGVIEAIGDGVKGVEVGDHVILAWVAPCRSCARCAAGQGWACAEGNDFSFDIERAGLSHEGLGIEPYLGLGTFSERLVLSSTAVVPIPRDVPFDVAALIGCAVATGTGAVLHNAGVEAGSSVAVVGCGGVGLSIVMGSQIAGAYPIIAVDISDEKLQLATTFGATHVVNAANTEDVDAAVRAIVPDGVDYSFDAVGHTATATSALSVMSMAGTAVLVGMPSEGTSLAIDPLALSASGQTIIGSNYGGTVPLVDFPMLSELYLAGRLPVDLMISHRIGLDEVEHAFEEMRAGRRARSVVTFD
jgi:S-(hydroxymethyl)glutathione dehydrogenase/alcohol dehydrogenase